MIGINQLIIVLLYLMDRVIFFLIDILFIKNNYLNVFENVYHFCYFNTSLLR
jgi:hypothetical protein